MEFPKALHLERANPAGGTSTALALLGECLDPWVGRAFPAETIPSFCEDQAELSPPGF